MGIVKFCPLGDRFPVGDAGLYIDIQMEFAHPFDNRVTRFVVHIGPESRIFLGETVQGLGHVNLGFIILRDDSQRDDRFRHEHGGHVQINPGGYKGITGSTLDTE